MARSACAHDLTDAVIVRVANIDRAVRTDHGAMRAVEPGIGGGTAVAVPSLAAADNGRDNAARVVDTADRVVLGIDDQQAAVAVQRHLLRRVEDGGGGRAAVAAVAAPGRASDRLNQAGGGIDGAQAAALAFED